ncbi:Uma2 family endonuclease, partial [Methylovulum sp.]|uniref:Uma2 family endonuclease n=1 Tax=Methylovulum sp. TaxID=1916980 RepID=UPI0026032893
MTAITQLSQLDLNATYSYADYLTWRLEESVELIRGKIMLMTPAPNVKHQRIVTNLGGALFNYFHKKPCQLFYAPFDVSLYDSRKSRLADSEIFTVMQPDLCVVCDSEKLTTQGCN